MTSEQNTIIPQAKRLGVSTTDEGLVQVEIQLRKFRITVCENDYGSRYRLSLLFSDIYNQFEPSENGKEPKPKTDADRVRESLLLYVWAPLTSCSSGEVPTQEEFFRMPESDINYWVETARELGMQFPYLDEMEKIAAGLVTVDEKADLKKSGRSRRKSSQS